MTTLSGILPSRPETRADASRILRALETPSAVPCDIMAVWILQDRSLPTTDAFIAPLALHLSESDDLKEIAPDIRIVIVDGDECVTLAEWVNDGQAMLFPTGFDSAPAMADVPQTTARPQPDRYVAPAQGVKLRNVTFGISADDYTRIAAYAAGQQWSISHAIRSIIRQWHGPHD